ncbi:MAG: hypothetical protein MI861_17405, partial [Pirellulales bacterium]|nr:hypothetical protein [Pirellulales bacterium]
MKRWGVMLAALLPVVACKPKTHPPEPPASQVAPTPDQRKAAVLAALRRGDATTAEQLLGELLLIDPSDTGSLELAADVAADQGKHEQALEYYRSALESHPHPSPVLMDKYARLWMVMGRPFESVAALEAAVKAHPDQRSLRRDLGGLQSALGLEQKAFTHLKWLVQRGYGDTNVLIQLSDLARPQTDEASCNYALQKFKADLRPQYALMRVLAYKAKWEDVAGPLKQVIDQHPDFEAAHAYYVRAVVETDDVEALSRWQQLSPQGIETQPQYWLAMGIWAEKRGLDKQAARAFWEAARLDESNGESLSRLAGSLAKVGHVKEAQLVAERAGRIAAVRSAVETLFSWHNNSQAAAVRIGLTMEELGRLWEATAWLQAAFSMTRHPDARLKESYARIRSALKGDTPWQIPEYLVTPKIDIQQLPRAAWQ